MPPKDKAAIRAGQMPPADQSGDRSVFSNSSARLSSSSAIRRSWLERGVGWVPAISRNRSARCRKKRASWREIICSLNELRCRNRGALQQVPPERRMRGEWRRNAVAGAGGGPYDPALMTPLPQLTTLDRFRLSSLDRYILRQCLSVTLFVTAALSAAVWLAQSLRLVDLIVNRGLSAEVFLYLALLILPRFFDIVLPMGAFIAVLFLFNRLIAESELVVMRAAGLSPLTLARPVMALAGIAFLVLLAMSAYFLPASNREFKDLQFEIRNRFVASLLQEGTFTNISDQLTIYIGGRDRRGEVTGLLVNDDRAPQKPVTITAERGAFAESGGGSRIVMVNGNRQEYDRATGKLSVLTFERYTLDLDQMRDAPVVRFPEAQERYLGELFFPPPGLDPIM